MKEERDAESGQRAKCTRNRHGNSEPFLSRGHRMATKTDMMRYRIILTARDFHTQFESSWIEPKRCMDNSSQDSRYRILTLATCTPFKVPAFQRQPDRKHLVWSIINIPLKHQRLVTPKPVAQLLHLFPYAMLKVLWSSQLRLAALRVLCAVCRVVRCVVADMLFT
jgi:hypothetical protein